ncbi:MAG: Fe-S cluster assembly protein SufD [Candidatus Omnitrophota bacterium]
MKITEPKTKPRNIPPFIADLRKNGRELYEKMGLPTSRMEEWRHTDVSELSKYEFVPIDSIGIGERHPNLERLSEAMRHNPGVSNYLGHYARPEENFFVALNDAFFDDGAFIHIPEGIRTDTPIHLTYVHSPNRKKKTDQAKWALFPRNLVIVEKDASVTLIEDYIGDYRNYPDETDDLYLNVPVTEILLMEGAEAVHYKLQRESARAFHIASVDVKQEAGSRFISHNVTLGGQLTRNNIHSYLRGTGASCTLNGLFVLNGNRHADHHTLIDHGAPGCTSRELYHCILNDRARGVFNGRIYVHSGAQQTDSNQTVRALLLSNDARMDARPQLEIYADDVKCTHGAAVGQLDDDSIYYLRSRGIGHDEARKMLIQAFSREITGAFTLEPLQKEVEHFFEHFLSSEIRQPGGE